MVARRTSPFGLHRYGPVLRAPGAVALLLGILLGRAGQFGAGLALLLAAEQTSGSFGVAGTATGLLAAGIAVGRIVSGRLIDRHGAPRVLAATTVLFAAAAAGLVGVLATSGALVPLLALSAAVGLTMPDIGTVARLALGGLSDATEVKTSAYALETLTTELSAIGGPAAAAFAAAAISPTASLSGTAALLLAGTAVVARSRPARGVGGRARAGARRGKVVRAMRTLIAVSFGIGLTFGALEVAVTATAVDRGAAGTTGLLLGATALGSAVGALWYGARVWHARCETRLLVAAGVFSAACALLVPMPSLLALGLLLPLVGAPITPLLTTVYLLGDKRVPRERLGEAFSLLMSSIPSGVALGTALAGWTTAAAGPRAALGLVALLSLSAFAAAALDARGAARPVRATA